MTNMPRTTRKATRGQIITSFNVPIEEEPLIEKTDEYAHREGKSRGQVIALALRDYLNVHGEGNPQIPLLESETLLTEYKTDRITERLRRFSKDWTNQEAWLKEFDRFMASNRIPDIPELTELLKVCIAKAKRLRAPALHNLGLGRKKT